MTSASYPGLLLLLLYLNYPSTTISRGLPRRTSAGSIRIIPTHDPAYCDETEIKNRVAQSGSGQMKRTIEQRWPYDCVRLSIVFYAGKHQLMRPIEECCKKCYVPKFLHCLLMHQEHSVWYCSVLGFHCISDCMYTQGPKRVGRGCFINGLPRLLPAVFPRGIGGPPAGIGSPPARMKKLSPPDYLPTYKCEKEETQSDGTICIRRLCIPVEFQ